MGSPGTNERSYDLTVKVLFTLTGMLSVAELGMMGEGLGRHRAVVTVATCNLLRTRLIALCNQLGSLIPP